MTEDHTGQCLLFMTTFDQYFRLPSLCFLHEKLLFFHNARRQRSFFLYKRYLLSSKTFPSTLIIRHLVKEYLKRSGAKSI
jgi:hypothetical protein